MFQAMASAEYKYDQSVVAVAEVPALSLWSALSAEYLLTALMAMSVALEETQPQGEPQQQTE